MAGKLGPNNFEGEKRKNKLISPSLNSPIKRKILEDFIPSLSSSYFVKLLKNFGGLSNKEKSEFFDALKELEKTTSSIFLINSLININNKNLNEGMLKNSLILISKFYLNLSDEVQKTSVFRSLDELDEKGLVVDSALSLINSCNFSTLSFLLNYLYRGDKQLDKEKFEKLNKAVFERIKSANSPSELISIFDILSKYQVDYKPFKEFAKSHLSSDEYVGKAYASYLIATSTKNDRVMAAIINREAAKESALFSNDYYVLSIDFLTLPKSKRKELIYNLISISKKDLEVKKNLKLFVKSINKNILDSAFLSSSSKIEKIVEGYSPHQKYKLGGKVEEILRKIFYNSNVDKTKLYLNLKNLLMEMNLGEVESEKIIKEVKEEYKKASKSLLILKV